jgi:hypothetical protein
MSETPTPNQKAGKLTKVCPECGGSGLIALGERQYDDCACLSAEEKADQATRCGCRGQDDYCPCQNAPDRQTTAGRTALHTQGEEKKP